MGRLQFVVLEISDSLLQSCVLQVEGFFLKFEVQKSLLGLEKSFHRLLLALVQVIVVLLEFFNLLLTELFPFLASGQLVHGLADKLVDLDCFGSNFFSGGFEFGFEDFLFLGDFRKLGFQVDLDHFLKGLIDLLHVVELILELLNFVKGVLMLRFGVHLSWGLSVTVDETALELSVLRFDFLNTLVGIFYFFTSDLNLTVTILNLLFERFQVLFVLLLNLP